ncbi:MAG: T9SS type A sorting domain-containing protein [Bacteroidota bacterium]
MRLLAYGLVLFALTSARPLQGQVVINEVFPTSFVELKNIGSDSVDVSSYWLCNFPSYAQIGELRVDCGDLNIAPGEILTVRGFDNMNGSDAELGLYTSDQFSDPAAIIDYLEWGTPNHQRSSVAVAAGIWDSGAFAGTISNGSSIQYDGNGDRVSDWNILRATSLCQENAIQDTCSRLDGGLLVATSPTEICAGDGIPDPVGVALTRNTGNASAWVVTDPDGNILDIPSTPPFDFEGAGEGVCLIWYLSYIPGLTGLTVGSNVSDLAGCYDFSNAITVTRTGIDGGTISTSDPTEICAGDGVGDPIDVTLNDAIGDSSAWVITDTFGIILGLPAAPPFDLEGAGEGVCLIWHLSYNTGLTGLSMGAKVEDLAGACFGFSNPITVDRTGVDGGELTALDPTTICAGDGVQDTIDVLLVGGTGTNLGWIITDDAGVILDLPAGPPFNFEGAGAGICRVYHIGYEDGLTGLMMSQNISGLSGCFDLSNAIEVIRIGGNTTGGQISTNDATTICAGDGVDDPINVSVSGNMGANSAWLITDPDGIILELPMSPPFNFEGAGGGVCLIWHLSYEDGLEGLERGLDANNLRGCYSLSNAIAVNRNGVDGGTISTNDNTNVCTEDGTGDFINVSLSDASGSNSGWIITDTAGLILGLPMAPPFNFDDAPTGVCLIWHISFDDGLMGLMMGQNANDLQGCFDLSNPISVVRTSINGGQISTTDETTICAGDGQGDPIDVSLSDATGSNSAWVITDTAGLILGLPPAPPFDLDGAGGGVCLIWHLSFEDGLTGLMMGQNASDLSGACFDLSNPISVVRNNVDGGTISTTDPTTICAGDGQGDPIDVTLVDAEGSNSGWIITDTAGLILGLPPAPPFDLDEAGPGVCLIWHISYEDGLTGLMMGGNAADLTGCFNLSNSISVVRNGVDGGTISTNDPTTICAGDGQGDPIDVTLMDNEGTNSAWVITDTAGLILGLPPAPPFDLDGAGPGVCLIWHLSFEAGLTGLMMGGNASDLTGCFDLSNPISVTRNGVDGGTISTSDPTTICAGDGQGDPIDVSLADATGSNSGWIITDTAGLILGLPPAPPFDLDGAGGGICLIWHISYEDGLTGLMMGGNAGDLDGCFDLSNSISVTRNNVDGGTISTTDPTIICAGDNSGDPIDVTLEGAEGSNSGWIITDTAGLILGLPAAPPFDLDGAGPGVCLIWHISYEDGLTGLMMNANASGLDGCFNLSNPISVTRYTGMTEGGQITTTDPTDICAGDGVGDPIDVSLMGNMGSNSAWVITDSEGIILGLPAAPPFDLDEAGPGVCLIWHLSFEDGLAGLMMGENANDLQGCFDLSNPITVNRTQVNGGEISTTDPTTICAGDGEGDPIDVSLMGNEGTNSAWVITDTAGLILGLPAAPPFDLDGAGPGVCLIWHLSYEDGLMGLMMDGNANDLSGACFDLSNPISVIREGVDGGQISTTDPTTICAGDGSPDPIDVTLSDAIGDSSAWVITDTTGLILGLPAAPPFDLEGAGPGVCLIWHLSYNGDITGVMMNGNASDIDGCFDLSNPITVIRNSVEGGQISTTDPTTICAGDNSPDPIDVSLSGATGDSSVWVITDTTGLILGLPAAPPFDLDGAGPGVCLIWHLSYTGDLSGLSLDQNASDLSGCFALSNPIEVIRVTSGPECVTSTYDLDPANIQLDMRPNPVTEQLFVDLTLTEVSALTTDIRITTTTGQLVQQLQYDTETRLQFTLDLETLPAGIYLLSVQNERQILTRRFVKQ